MMELSDIRGIKNLCKYYRCVACNVVDMSSFTPVRVFASSVRGTKTPSYRSVIEKFEASLRS